MPVKDTSMPAPSATEPFIDRYRRVTPKWYPWIKRMIDSLRQTVLTVNTIETNVGTIDTTVDLISADLTSVEITVAALQDTTVEQGLEIAETLTLVSGLQGDLGTVEVNLETLGGNLTTTNANLATTNSNLSTTNANLAALDGEVSTLETSINGQLDTIDSQIAGIGGDIGAIHARWGVAINGNNQVIGLVQLDGGASGSQFSVVADKFVVAHPAAPGTTITAFVVGLVDGVSTVGINGNVLVDGSILARHISVSSIDAISASFGNAAFEDSAYSVTEIGGEPALTIDFSTPRIRMLSA